MPEIVANGEDSPREMRVFKYRISAGRSVVPAARQNKQSWVLHPLIAAGTIVPNGESRADILPCPRGGINSRV